MPACRDGVIDKAELKDLMQKTDGGREKVTKHKVRGEMPPHHAGRHALHARRHVHLFKQGCRPLAHYMQDWLTEADVQRWLEKFDWDSSGDIDYLEFEALVCASAKYSSAPAELILPRALCSVHAMSWLPCIQVLALRACQSACHFMRGCQTRSAGAPCWMASWRSMRRPGRRPAARASPASR